MKKSLTATTAPRRAGINDVDDKSGSAASLPAKFLRLFLSHKNVVSALGAAGMLAGLLYSLSQEPIYEACSQLKVLTLNTDYSDTQIRDSAATTSEAAFQTESEMRENGALKQRVLQQLLARAHPSAIQRKDAWSRAKRTFGIGDRGDLGYSLLLNETAKHATVSVASGTHSVQIACDSRLAEAAALYCNTLVEEFREEHLGVRGDQAKRASEHLLQEAAEIRGQVQGQRARLRLARSNATPAGPLPAEHKDWFSDLQSALVIAQANRIEKQAELVSVHAAIEEKLLSEANGTAYSGERERLALLQAQATGLRATLTETNPRVIRLRAQIREAKQAIARESAAGGKSLQDDYQAARHRELLLQAAYSAKLASRSDPRKSSESAVMQRKIQAGQQLDDALVARANRLAFASTMPVTTIQVLAAARVPAQPMSPRKLVYAAIGLALGSFAGLLVIVVEERNARVLRLPDETRRILHIEELGAVPSAVPSAGWRVRRRKSAGPAAGYRKVQHSEPAMWAETFSQWDEIYSGISQTLLRPDRMQGAHMYIVTSPDAVEGKSTVVAHLGVALSRLNLRVALVDGNLHKPALDGMLHVRGDIGLSNILEPDFEPIPSWLALACRRTQFANLDVLSAGRSSAEIGEVLHSTRLRRLKETLRKNYDIVLIDTPPMTQSAETHMLGGDTDGAILVFRAGVTTREHASRACGLLATAHIPIIGSVLTDFQPRHARGGGTHLPFFGMKKTSGRETSPEDMGAGKHDTRRSA